MARIWEKKCPVCGAEFEARTHNTKYCPACREREKQAGKRLPKGKRMLCAHCGKRFESLGGARFCSQKCRMATKRKIEAMTKRKHEKLSMRVCHDCGRPTTDYRCADCREKFRQRHNVSPEASCPEAWLYA